PPFRSHRGACRTSRRSSASQSRKRSQSPAGALDRGGNKTHPKKDRAMDHRAETNASIGRQDVGGDQLQAVHETAATSIAAAAKAAIEARYILALKRPRDWDTVRTRLLKECDRPGFADAAIYRKPVGKKKDPETGRYEQSFVEGLSV